MSVAQLHARSSRPGDFRILGVRLLPLMVGHLRHLEAEDVDPVRTPGDLGTAVRICSMPPDRWLRWRDSALAPVRLAVWGRRLGQWDFQDKLALWADYVRWNTELPVLKFKGDGRESVLPSYRFTRVKLMRMGYGVSCVDSTPYLDALWDIAAAAELDGTAEALDATAEDLEKLSAQDLSEVARRATEELAAKLREDN